MRKEFEIGYGLLAIEAGHFWDGQMAFRLHTTKELVIQSARGDNLTVAPGQSSVARFDQNCSIDLSWVLGEGEFRNCHLNNSIIETRHPLVSMSSGKYEKTAKALNAIIRNTVIRSSNINLMNVELNSCLFLVEQCKLTGAANDQIYLNELISHSPDLTLFRGSLTDEAWKQIDKALGGKV